MTNEEIKELAEQSAQEAVRQTFRMFGVDTDSQDSVNEFRSDLVFAREMRRATKSAQNKIMMVVISVLVVAGCAALWRGMGMK